MIELVHDLDTISGGRMPVDGSGTDVPPPVVLLPPGPPFRRTDG